MNNKLNARDFQLFCTTNKKKTNVKTVNRNIHLAFVHNTVDTSDIVWTKEKT